VDVFLPLLQQDWFNLIQSLGIVCSIALTATALHREARARKLGHYLTLVAHHRELWSETHRRPDLARIFKDNVDLVAAPITIAEEEFLNLVIEHFTTGWLVAKNTAFLNRKVLAADARTFFARPLPRTAWTQTKHARDPRFVRFIEDALTDSAKRKSP
jgi:hypothetical protein